MTLEELQSQVTELTAKLEKSESDRKALSVDLMKFKAKAKGADIDPEEHMKLQTRADELASELAKAQKVAKSEVDRLSKALEQKEQALTQHLIDAGLKDAALKSSVAPHYLAAVTAMFKTQAKLVADGAEYKAMIGDKPLAEFIATWAQTDEGKPFVAAADNHGGGAAGGNGGTAKPNADFGGTKQQRIAAIAAKFPELSS